MSIKLTKGESYIVAKENNTPIIVESSDSAGAVKQFNNDLVVSASNGSGRILTYQTDSSVFKLNANDTAKQVLGIKNINKGASADAYVEWHCSTINDAWSMGIDASTDHAFKLEKGNGLSSAQTHYQFGNGDGPSNMIIGWKDGYNSSLTIYDGDDTDLNRIILGANGSGAYIDSDQGSGGSYDVLLKANGTEQARWGTGGFNVGTAADALSHFSVQTAETADWQYGSIFKNDHSNNNVKVIVVKNDSGDSCQIYSDGDIYNDNDSYGQISSDVRMKERITDLPDDILDRLLKIRPCNYYWREEVKFDSSEKKLGFIAQEIQKQFPDIVTGAGYGQELGIEDPLTVTTSKLIPYLVKSIQLLEARVKELESK